MSMQTKCDCLCKPNVLISPYLLQIKQRFYTGALVMLRHNVDIKKGLHNGALFKVPLPRSLPIPTSDDL